MTDTPNIKKPNPFSPESLSVQFTGGEEFTVKTLITVVPVRKPSNKEWVRAHPSDDYFITVAILEDAEGGQPYVVSPQIAAAYQSEVKAVGLRLAVTRQNAAFLWKHPLPDVDGRENYWNTSHRSAIEEAKTQWVRMTSSRSMGAYNVQTAAGIDTEPSWPELTLEALLEIAFSGRLISDPNHILLRQLRGEA